MEIRSIRSLEKLYPDDFEKGPFYSKLKDGTEIMLASEAYGFPNYIFARLKPISHANQPKWFPVVIVFSRKDEKPGDVLCRAIVFANSNNICFNIFDDDIRPVGSFIEIETRRLDAKDFETRTTPGYSSFSVEDVDDVYECPTMLVLNAMEILVHNGIVVHSSKSHYSSEGFWYEITPYYPENSRSFIERLKAYE